MKITLIGLGVNDGDLSLKAYKKIKSSENIIVKTSLTESYKIFKDENIKNETLDKIYESTKNFDTLNKKLAAYVLNEAKSREIIYCVDGSAECDTSAKIIIKKHKDTEVFGGISKGSACLAKLGIPENSFMSVSAYDALKIERFTLPLVVYDIDNNFTAGSLKLKLADLFGDETPCFMFRHGKYNKMRLCETDYGDDFDYSCVLVIPQMPLTEKQRYNSDDLFEILKVLRSENGCPWDKVQTKESIRVNMIEEAYELVDAINRDDDDMIKEEIGDVVLQAEFHILFGEERGAFTKSDVLTGICKKLIERHTHIFGVDKAKDEKSALDIWDKNKRKEKGYTCGGEYLKAVPNNFPAAMRAEKVMNRAKKYNFEFENVEQIFDKIDEEIGEVRAEIISGNKQKLKMECGDLLASSVNAVRFLGIECEEALTLSTEKFINRFSALEQLILSDGKDIKNLTPAEIDVYYNEVKKSENR